MMVYGVLAIYTLGVASVGYVVGQQAFDPVEQAKFEARHWMSQVRFPVPCPGVFLSRGDVPSQQEDRHPRSRSSRGLVLCMLVPAQCVVLGACSRARLGRMSNAVGSSRIRKAARSSTLHSDPSLTQT